MRTRSVDQNVNGRRKCKVHLLSFAVSFICILFATVPARAATFTVNSTYDGNPFIAPSLDANDANPGDGVCATDPSDPNGVECTLRAAVMEANALPGSDTIIVPAGTYTIWGDQGGWGAQDSAALGDLDITDSVTISGAGAETTIIEQHCSSGIDSQGICDRVFEVVGNPTTKVEISGVTIRGGFVNPTTLSMSCPGPFGAGICNANAELTLRNCIVKDNFILSLGFSSGGGGIFSTGPLTVINSTITHNNGDTSNLSSFQGGGILASQSDLTVINSTISDNVAVVGGGIRFDGQGRITITNSTISNNSLFWPFPNPVDTLFGGGLAIFGGHLTLTNSTVSGNSASGYTGGGIFLASGFPAELNNVTITNNTAGLGGGMFIPPNASQANVQNSIIAGNTDTNGDPDCSGPLTSGGYNLIQIVSSGCTVSGTLTGNLTGVSPNLGPLADNGGPTQTHALLSRSPAIDAGNPNGCMDSGDSEADPPVPSALLTTDQRGAPRPQGVACDIGAYELAQASVDADGDGFTVAAGDCNDRNPNIHPGATEFCNGVDDNCNGTVDDNTVEAGRVCTTSQPGVCSTGTTICTTGILSCQQTTQPSAEVCDGLDNNCDGQVDEGAFQTFYLDADHDGYGDPTNFRQACNALPGYVGASGDCNDGNPNIHPNATELCNAVDDNCNSQVDEDTASTCNDGNACTIDSCGGAQGCLHTPLNCDDGNDCTVDSCNAGTCLYTLVPAGTSCNGDVGMCSSAGSCETGPVLIPASEPNTQFSLATNPNGVWSYGYTNTLGGTLTYFSNTTNNLFNIVGLEGWFITGINALSVATNRTSGPLSNVPSGGTFTLPPGFTAFHPGPTGQVAVLRWTAPCASVWHISGLFQGVDALPTTTDAHVLVNGGSAFDVLINNFGVPEPFDLSRSLNAGDTVDFAVGVGVNSNYIGDPTGLQVTIRASTFYRDADGDGYGDPTDSIETCGTPAGYVVNNTDCDDTNPAVHPGATEVCDGVNNNCNGQIDEGMTTTFYRDADSDGYGNSAITTQACSAPTGYVNTDGDCNDSNIAIHPGAVELCNGIDDNCNGQIDETFTDLGSACTAGIGACQRTGIKVCAASGTATECNATPGTPTPEICGDGIDQDCNGSDAICLPPPQLAVLTPNGGEAWPVGSTQTIQWKPNGVSGKVKIELSRDGGITWTVLFNNTQNDGTEAWTVTGPATSQALVRVSSVSTPSIGDTSNAVFTISGGSVTVIVPNGGETWPTGSTQTIRWSSSGLGGNVKIELSRDGGTTWAVLSKNVANTGSQTWKVTKPATTQARIRVSGVSDTNAVDASNANFTIQ